MSLKDRFNKPEPIPKLETKPVASTKPAPLPTATQRDFQEMQKKKDAEKAVLKLIEQNDQPEMKNQRNSEDVLEQPQKNEVITSDQAKDQQKTEKPDLTQKISDQRRPVGRPIGRPDDQLGDQSPSVVTQLGDQSTVGDHKLLGDQLGDQSYLKEQLFPSRTDRERIGLRLPSEKVARYKTWCFANKISLQDAFEQAMDKFIDDQLGDQSTVGDHKLLGDQLGDWSPTKPPLDLDIDNRSIDHRSLESDKLSYTIEIYKKWTGKEFNYYDHKFYQEIKHIEKEDIRLGIMGSIAGCKTEVGTFKYCIKAIKQSATIKDKKAQEQQILELLKRRNITIK